LFAPQNKTTTQPESGGSSKATTTHQNVFQKHRRKPPRCDTMKEVKFLLNLQLNHGSYHALRVVLGKRSEDIRAYCSLQ
jgi:hypothetical protein